MTGLSNVPDFVDSMIWDDEINGWLLCLNDKRLIRIVYRKCEDEKFIPVVRDESLLFDDELIAIYEFILKDKKIRNACDSGNTEIKSLQKKGWIRTYLAIKNNLHLN